MNKLTLGLGGGLFVTLVLLWWTMGALSDARVLIGAHEKEIAALEKAQEVAAASNAKIRQDALDYEGVLEKLKTSKVGECGDVDLSEIDNKPLSNNVRNVIDSLRSLNNNGRKNPR